MSTGRLYRTAPVGLAFLDTSLRYVHINDWLAAINGRSVNEHIGAHVRDMVPELAPMIEPIYRRVIETGKPALNFEVVGTTPADPTYERTCLVSYHPVLDDGDKVIGVSTVVQDITDRKQAERLALTLALPGEPIDLEEVRIRLDTFSLAEMNRCGAAIRSMNFDNKTKEEVAARVVRFLYENFVDEKDQRAFALVRCFEICSYNELSAELQRVAGSSGVPPSADMKFMVLNATTGDQDEWQDPRRSARHRLTPLPSAEAVKQLPMISQLLRELGLEIGGLLSQDSEIILKEVSRNVFHVAQAKGSPHIPAQAEFVVPFNIESVVGFGDVLPNGKLFVVIMFSKIPISQHVASLFSHLSLSLRMVLLPLVDTRFGIRSQLTAIDRLLKNQENIVDRQESQLRSEQQFLRKLLLLQERERKVVSHEIHDGMIQDIIAAHLHVQSIGGNSDPDKIDTALDQAASSLQKAVAEGRRLIRDLRPMIIDESGVIEAIRHLIADDFDETNVCVDFHHDVDFDRLDPMLESTIFRIVQEALNNVIRHGQSDHVAVQLTQADGFLMVEVRDDGVGFDPDQVSSQHFGLRGIRERARLFGGKATIKAQLGKGTSVHVRLPIPVP